MIWWSLEQQLANVIKSTRSIPDVVHGESAFTERHDEDGKHVGVHVASLELIREMILRGLITLEMGHYTLTDKGRELWARVEEGLS